MADKHLKSFYTSLAISEMQTKITKKFKYQLTNWQNFLSLTLTSVDKHLGVTWNHTHWWKSIILHNHTAEWLATSLKFQMWTFHPEISCLSNTPEIRGQWFFCKGPDHKYFRFCSLYNLCCSYSTLSRHEKPLTILKQTGMAVFQ